MSFTAKRWIFLILVCGGIGMIGFGAGLYQPEGEGIPFALSAVMCLAGGIMLVAAGIFMHLKMRCPFCHRVYPYSLVGWWDTECCPYCGEYLY